MTDTAGFEVRASRYVFEAGFLEVVEEDVESPDGEHLTRFTVRHPGAVVIVPVDGNGDVVLVRQFRTAARSLLLELPAGKREAGEEPVVTAARELQEEVGLRAGRWVKLSEFFNSPGFTDERTHIFLARDLEPHTPDDAEVLKAEERHMEIVRVPLDTVAGFVSTGEVADAKTIIGALLARDFLDGRASEFAPDG